MKRPLPFLLSVLLSSTILAQAPVLHLRSGEVSAQSVERADARTLFAAQADAVDGQLIRCLLFDHTLNAMERARLAETDIRFLAPLRPHAWVAAVPSGMDATPLFEHGLIAMHVLRGSDKLDPRLRDEMEAEGKFEVVLVPWKIGVEHFESVVNDGVRGSQPYGTQGARQALVSAREAERLLAHPLVQWMEPLPAEGKPDDLRGRAYHRLNRLGPVIPNGTGLDGHGVRVVVNDDGYVGPHVDFKGRTEQSTVAGDLIGTHGDMVAGIVGAAGNIDPRGVGMAPACDLTILQYIGTLPLTVPLHQDSGAVIFNSSYADGCNAGYTEVTQTIDQEVVDNPSILQVFSAGNEGENDCDYGAGTGWGTISGGHKSAKNVIAVANLTDADVLVNSSSCGPSADGRIKPDISAFGNGQMSDAPGYGYMTGSGTSAAAPGIAGVSALLYQGWRSLNGGDPPSALIKAFLLNTADDLGNTGPDYKYGWGGVNTERAWRAILEERWMSVVLDQDEVLTPQIEVPPNVKELRVMAYWMDPAGELLAINALVNDIDLAGMSPSGDGMMPWSLSIAPDPAALNTPATRAPDHLNNMEQVVVTDPEPGTWTFPLFGFDVPEGPQEVFLVYEFLFPEIDITWPENGEHLASGVTHRLRWDTPDRSTPVTVSYSNNGGGSWSSFNVPTGQRYFDLGIGDTVLTDLRFRVEQGGWTDEQTGITTMRTPEELGVPVNCVDSALLQWPHVVNAGSYIVHQLGDRYMLNVDTISSTSYWFTGLSAVHDDWFAVTAISTNGIRGERSIAVARPHDLVGCIAAQDLIVQEVLSPMGPVIACQPQAPLTVLVRNLGAQAVNGGTVGVRGADNTITTTSFPGTIDAGATLSVTVPGAQLGLVPGALADLTTWATSSAESFTPNDSLHFQLYVHDLTEQYPYVQDMEALDVCAQPGICDVPCPLGGGLVNGIFGVEDSLDWRIDAAGTSTINTGPDVDHTFGTAAGHYIYMESTGPCFGGDADLILPCFTVPSGPVALMYWYHMYGAGVGSLNVDLLADGIWQLDVVPPVVGDQGNVWDQGFVDLSPYAGQVVNARFRGVRGPSHYCDIALDDIHISSAVGVPEQNASALLHITPSAGTAQFLVRSVGAGQLILRDARGQLLWNRKVSGSGPSLIDLSAFAAGLYVLSFEGEGVQASARVVRD